MMKRRGSVNATWVIFLASIVALGVLVTVLVIGSRPPRGAGAGGAGGTRPLVVYCAAGIKPPVVAAAQAYEKLFGVQIQLQYGGSNTLLSQIKLAKSGDLFLPADESYLEMAGKEDLIRESIPLAKMTPVIAVAKGNPKKITGIADLMRADVRFSQANPDMAAIGKLTRDALQKTGEWEAFTKKATVTKGTVNDVANDIKVGAVDAGVVWDAVVNQYPELERVDAPQFKETQSLISIAVLKVCDQPAAALRFARFLGAKDQGLKEFAKFGYTPVEGDLWSASPKLNLFAGAMLRPAIEKTIQEFEVREGCQVSRVYNGCGILVGEMRQKIGPMPDAYFSCDTTFMTQVKDLFLDQSVISSNQLVILVPKGNVKGIKTLKDLGNPGIRLGIGHEKQCAMGALTATTLDQTGLRNTVRKNVVVESATGDMLVNQLRTGSLDAIIAYISNATDSGDKLEAISIDIPCAIATQPIAVSRESTNKQLAGRLMKAIESEESKRQFLANGFAWKLGAK